MAVFGRHITMAHRLKQHRQQEARRYALHEIDVFCEKQRQRIGLTLRAAERRIEKAKRGGEYGDEVIVTAKRS
jgi:hypothetical protein